MNLIGWLCYNELIFYFSRYKRTLGSSLLTCTALIFGNRATPGLLCLTKNEMDALKIRKRNAKNSVRKPVKLFLFEVFLPCHLSSVVTRPSRLAQNSAFSWILLDDKICYDNASSEELGGGGTGIRE